MARAYRSMNNRHACRSRRKRLRAPHILALIVCIVVSACTPLIQLNSASSRHPFLIVKEADFGALQSLASRSPWKEMKASAISESANLEYDQTQNYQKKCSRLSQIVSVNSLSYILDPKNRNTYKTNILNAFDYWDDLYPSLYRGGGDDWTHAVPPGIALFNCILAL